MLYNPHCAPLFSSNYMQASQLQKMCFVTPIASYLSLVRDTNKHPDPSISREPLAEALLSDKCSFFVSYVLFMTVFLR